MKGRRVSTVAFALLLSAGGCGKVLDYPKVQPEQGATLCRNDLDDDLDGDTDCDDLDCLGTCSEETPAECSDGRDNDGDGLTDAADPRCWLSSPPTAQRCAKAYGAKIVNHFDAAPLLLGIDQNQGVYESEWTAWGYDGERPIATRVPRLGPERRDLLLRFLGNTTGASTLDQNLGSYVRQLPFSGSLRGFKLSFNASVPPAAILRAAIVPVGLAPSTVPPIAGAETFLSVTIDALREPTLSLMVEGRASVSPLVGAEPGLGDGGCDPVTEDCLGRLVVTVDEDEVRATFTDANGTTTQVPPLEDPPLAPPTSLSLPPSRLVFWGSSPSGAAGPSGPGVRVDDLTLNVEPEFPCGFPAPQIPGTGCGADWNEGYTVSVARSVEGEYCALVTASDWDTVAQRLSPPRRLNAWHSPDGDHWEPAPLVSILDVGATLIGAGIGADSDGLHAALALRDEVSGTVALAFVDGASCAEWGTPALGPALPDDAEAPSYVIAHGRHEIYFTRPPTGLKNRTLWRVLRDAPEVEPELVAELPLGTEAPVSLQSIGSRDLVLAAPSRAGSGGRGVSLFVADAGLRVFRPVSSGPVLSLPPSPDLPFGEGKLGFDDREVLSAAFSFDGERGFLLYGGRTTEGAFFSDAGTPVLAVGTARLHLAGSTPSDSAVVPEKTCGNGTCDVDEDCIRCEADCPCGGKEFVGDVFAGDQPWKTWSSDPDPRAILYLGADPPAMSFAGGGPTWAALPLEQAITGDFELSFDGLLEFADNAGGVAYVGLGTEPLEPSSSAGPAPGSGVFAKLADCNFPFTASPVAVVEGFPFQANDEGCWVHTSQVLGAWQHVVLARQGNRVSLSTPADAWIVAAQDRPLCGTSATEVSYAGALPALTHLLIGFGGKAFEGSVVDGHPGTIANLKVRSFGDPDSCPAPKQRCDTGDEAPTCVDTSQSPEHCGACGRRCGALEACVNGACVCGSQANVPGILECGGDCIDPSSSNEHCGSCDHACSKECSSGLCDVILEGDCASPFAIPPEGGTLALGFLPPVSTLPTRFCESDVLSPLIGAWTPTRSGTADIMVDVGEIDSGQAYALDSVVAITDDATCSEWPACNDDITPGVELSSHLTFPVEANKTYRIGVWLWYYRPPTSQAAELRVGFAP